MDPRILTDAEYAAKKAELLARIQDTIYHVVSV